MYISDRLMVFFLLMGLSLNFAVHVPLDGFLVYPHLTDVSHPLHYKAYKTFQLYSSYFA